MAQMTFLATQLTWINEVAKKNYKLPEGVCFWQQGSLLANIPTGPSAPNCPFQVRDPEFLEILGPAPKVHLVAKTDAHEGGVYHPATNEFFFASSRFKIPYTEMLSSTERAPAAGRQNAEVKKVSVATGEVSTVFAVTDVANGMAIDLEGNLLICQQGQGKTPGYIQRVDVKTWDTIVVADNWFGVPFNSPNDILVKSDGSIWFTDPVYARVYVSGYPFNSPNDVVVKSDGSIWFTDPVYARAQGFKSKPQVEGQLYRISPEGFVDSMASNFQRPNGLAFSEDEKRLYVTDTGFETGTDFDNTKRHHIFVYEVYEDGTLSGRRLFASVGVYDGSSPGLGVPDGIKVDTKGRVYIGTPDGVQVFSRSGKPLGLIGLPGVCNLGFGGEHLNKLYILNDESVHMIELQTTGAGLHFAANYKHES